MITEKLVKEAANIASSTLTPFYLYDLSSVRDAARLIRELFPDWTIAYSVKANPHPTICRLLFEMGIYAEVASIGEVKLSLGCGVLGNRVIYAGPAKHRDELKEALRLGVQTINADSIRELNDLAQLQLKINPLCNVNVRVNTSGFAAAAKEQMAGGASKFGIDEEVFFDLIRPYYSILDLSGIHIYIGSQILYEPDIEANFEIAIKLAQNWCNNFGTNHVQLIFGGGFGVPYELNDQPLPIDVFAHKLQAIYDKYKMSKSATSVTLELGRFLVAQAGCFVTRVLDVKSSRGKVFVIVDGGMNAFARPAFMKTRHRCRIISDGNILSTGGQPVVICGPLCTPIDNFGEYSFSQIPKEGDCILFEDAGAYGYSMSFQNFLGHRKPVEIFCP